MKPAQLTNFFLDLSKNHDQPAGHDDYPQAGSPQATHPFGSGQVKKYIAVTNKDHYHKFVAPESEGLEIKRRNRLKIVRMKCSKWTSHHKLAIVLLRVMTGGTSPGLLSHGLC